MYCVVRRGRMYRVRLTMMACFQVDDKTENDD